ncbi:uncharacterized protein LOC111832512 [Capsella rubella]|uniref:uncharacterized protein LOC111832512 n=1 Tax=Capsella rubella TaxID=81985 RepID=UPI000CD519A4|nr:uncharacterized protein LOC111832512 [Capsella rubella]
MNKFSLMLLVSFLFTSFGQGLVSCIEAGATPLSDQCQREIDCHGKCNLGARCKLGACICNEQMDNVLHCSRDLECNLKCPGRGGFCNTAQGVCECLKLMSDLSNETWDSATSTNL